jgi:hypothetical protein
VEVVIAKPPMSAVRIVLAVLGTMVAIGVLVHSQKDDHPSAATAGQTKIVAKASSAKCGATLAEYQALQIGSSPNHAVRIIGCSGTELGRVAYGGQESLMVSYSGEERVFTNMNATFDNDRLVAKAQLGLE